MAEIKKHFEMLEYRQLIHNQIDAVNNASRNDLTIYFSCIDHLERLLTPKLDRIYYDSVKQDRDEYAKAVENSSKDRGLMMEYNKILYNKKFRELMKLMNRLGWLG